MGDHFGGSREQVAGTLRTLLIEIGKIDEMAITDDASLDDSLKIDSITLVSIQSAFQDVWDVDIDPVEIVERAQFGLIVDYLWQQVREARR